MTQYDYEKQRSKDIYTLVIKDLSCRSLAFYWTLIINIPCDSILFLLKLDEPDIRNRQQIQVYQSTLVSQKSLCLTTVQLGRMQ